MEENKQIRIPLREDYRNGDLLRGRDVNKITHRVNELTGDIDKIDIDLSGKLDTSAYTEDKAAIESRIDGLAGELSTKEDISAHTADMEAIRASLDNKVEVSAYTENNTRLDGRINSVVNQCTRLDISKQDKLSAGTNITIENDVISAQQPDLSPYALSADVATELAKKVDSSAYTQDKAAMQASITANTAAITQLGNSKQDKLTAGENITIQNNVISAQQPDVSGKMNKVDYEVAYTLPSGAIDLSPLDNVLTPGIYNLKVNSFIPNTSYNGVLMVGRQGNSFSQEVVISGSQTQVLKRATSNSGSTWTTMYAGCLAHVNDNSDGNGYGGINETYSANKILTLIDEKQNVLSAGTGIQIQNDVISLSGAGGAMIDDNVTGTTTCWSSQKIVNEMGIGLIDLTNSGNAIRF